ncbi:hypothetical protein [Sciscionella sediminilitoris]|uniref:hypothetical protein n=1 Tax=Sciscionella sediminilitoris TaxID=1445613 RepID=UPI0012E101D7|nr:hypothetical protein [Sciscionella sp. SE31]
MPEHHFDERDKAHLDEAARLISDVLDGKPAELTTQVISLLCGAIHNIQIGERYLGVQP